MDNTSAHAQISFRIGPDLWLTDRRFEDLKVMLHESADSVDQVMLFNANTHAPLRLEIIKERAEVLKRRLAAIREMGCEAGVNVLTTIGHHEENLPNSLSGDYVQMTSIDGAVSLGSFCPNDEGIREYVRELYRVITSTAPDYIWIDDDIRFWHWPNGEGCFCDNCLAIFAEECGTRYSRERLGEALAQGPTAGSFPVKKAWLQHNRNTVSRLFELIEKTIHELRPGLPIGFMTGDRFTEGYDFDTWAKLLSGPRSADVMWRPGGGFYRETDPREMTRKSLSVARQVALLPECVRSIQPEIERIPSNCFGSSNTMMSTQAGLYMAAGGTGAAFNSFLDEEDPPELAFPLLRRIKELRPFYDLIVGTMGRSKPVGIFDFWNKDLLAVSWVAPSHDLFGAGLPPAYDLDGSTVALLSGDSILSWQGKADRIEQLLSRGVYMDSTALTRLNSMGFGHLTGFEVERMLDVDCIEEYTEHSLNGGVAHRLRDARQSFLDETRPAAVLRATQPGAQSLSGLIDYTPKSVASCCTGVFENQLGGRVCVAGYYPWTLLHFFAKLEQLKSVVRWLSKDTLPAYVASGHRVYIWVRPAEGGGLAIALINAHFDPAEGLALMVRTDSDRIVVYDMDCSRTEVASSGGDGPYKRFILPRVCGWEMRLCVATNI